MCLFVFVYDMLDDLGIYTGAEHVITDPILGSHVESNKHISFYNRFDYLGTQHGA